MKENELKALKLIADFARLRPTELGLLMFKRDPHSRKYTEAICRNLKEKKLVLARKLPGGIQAGTLYVLSEAGARALARAYGPGFKSGKNYGKTVSGEWIPPANYKHEILAAAFLAQMAADGHEVYSENQLRGIEHISEKHPDGLVIFSTVEGDYGMWIEVENTRKSGKNLENMCKALHLASVGRPLKDYMHKRKILITDMAAVVIDPDALDDRGYKLNHLERIKNCMAKIKRRDPTELNVYMIKRKCLGIESIEISTIVIDNK